LWAHSTAAAAGSSDFCTLKPQLQSLQVSPVVVVVVMMMMMIAEGVVLLLDRQRGMLLRAAHQLLHSWYYCLSTLTDHTHNGVHVWKELQHQMQRNEPPDNSRPRTPSWLWC